MSEELTPPRFPTMLRKMWSGGEVQAWIDENWNRRAQPAAPADAAPSVAPEPVAWTTQLELNWIKNNTGRAGSFYEVKAGPNDIPLFAHPPRAPLTDAEIVSIMEACLNDWDWKEFARAVESAVRQEQPHG